MTTKTASLHVNHEIDHAPHDNNDGRDAMQPHTMFTTIKPTHDAAATISTMCILTTHTRSDYHANPDLHTYHDYYISPHRPYPLCTSPISSPPLFTTHSLTYTLAAAAAHILTVQTLFFLLSIISIAPGPLLMHHFHSADCPQRSGLLPAPRCRTERPSLPCDPHERKSISLVRFLPSGTFKDIL
jgi:hypothetical protein